MFVMIDTFLLSCAGDYSTESFSKKGVYTVNSRSKPLLDTSASSLRPNSKSGPEPGLEMDPRWELAKRIVSSQQFVKSARLQDFLLYVCRCALENRIDEISEQKIGDRVFERGAGYNPNEDNIVRSQARLLRQW